MDSTHLLNLRVLADANVDDYALIRFQGREAISEPFDYHIELYPTGDLADVSGWIGKLAEFDVSLENGDQRIFAGRIYETRVGVSAGLPAIQVRIRPAYYALAFGRGTHCIQDKTSRDIFEAMTADVPGLVTSINLSPAPPKRGYSVRYDETEFDYLQHLLAQDGIAYFFLYDRGAGPYRHKMIVSTSPGDYVDVPGGDEVMVSGSVDAGMVTAIEGMRRAAPRSTAHHAFNVNKLDTPWTKSGLASDSWGKVYPHSYDTMGGEADAQGDLSGRASVLDEAHAQSAEQISGSGDSPGFCAGGRIKLMEKLPFAAQRIVLTEVLHSAHDPSMMASGGEAHYANSFTGMDASKICRPPVPHNARRVGGPILGTVNDDDKSAEGEAKVDDQSRIPVKIAQATVYDGAKKLPKFVWLPVQQQWAHSTHGAQFFPRIGTRVIVDFLYGNPDLPFVAGTMYTPSQKYPFDPASKVTQSGWRSVTDKNGSIKQEFHFEDKPGEEEIYLYTGRDYRREVDHDDFGTVKNDQTLEVKNNRKLTVTGTQETKIDKTQTVTVTQKSSLESMKEIELKVGPSSIKITMDKIVIEAPQIEINGTATVKVKAPMVEANADAMAKVEAGAMLTLKGAIVMIN